jgi:hypothetical protein
MAGQFARLIHPPFDAGDAMKTTRARPVVFLWAAIVAMLLGLAGLVGLVHSASVRIDAMDRWIVDDTAPSVVAVETASVDLGKLLALLRDHLRTPAERAGRDARIAENRAAMHASVDRYLGLPMDVGEAPVFEEMRRRVERFDGVVDRVLATTESTPPRARDDLRVEFAGGRERHPEQRAVAQLGDHAHVAPVGLRREA